MAHRVTRFLGFLSHGIQKHISKSVATSPLPSNPSIKNLGRSLEELRDLKLPCHARNSSFSKFLSQLPRPGFTPFPDARKILPITSYRCAHSHAIQKFGAQTVKRDIFRVDLRGCRAYHVDNRGIKHFKRRGPISWTEKLATQRSMGMLLVVVGGVTLIYFTNRQTIPYTHRKHLVLVSPSLERSIGDQTFEMIMKQNKTKVLPANHPQSLRVHKIADEIIEALMRGVKASDWGELESGGPDVMQFPRGWDRDADSKSSSDLFALESRSGHAHTHANDPADDTWVEQSRNHGLQTGQEGYSKHLEGMKWKVVVVDDDIVNAMCIPGGKIVVFTGLLKKFRSDAEVATVLAHEVGHAVARHSAESLTHNVFIVAVQLIILSVFYVPGLVSSVSDLLLRLPFSRRMEIEADHIGLILMAAAGYDPRLAPGFYEKLGTIEKTPEYAQYMSTHPSGKTRGEKLRNTTTMAEAMTIYRQRMAGQGIEGFF